MKTKIFFDFFKKSPTKRGRLRTDFNKCFQIEYVQDKINNTTLIRICNAFKTSQVKKYPMNNNQTCIH